MTMGGEQGLYHKSRIAERGWVSIGCSVRGKISRRETGGVLVRVIDQ